MSYNNPDQSIDYSDDLQLNQELKNNGIPSVASMTSLTNMSTHKVKTHKKRNSFLTQNNGTLSFNHPN